MMIIGVDDHPSFQAIAFFVEETGECGEQELKDSDGQAEEFYRDLKQRGILVRVGNGGYWVFAYSALASFRMGMSGSASFQRVRKSL